MKNTVHKCLVTRNENECRMAHQVTMTMISISLKSILIEMSTIFVVRHEDM